MITKVGNNYVISADLCWRPGSYESERAARMAQRYSDEILNELRELAIKTNAGVITERMIEEMKRGRNE